VPAGHASTEAQLLAGARGGDEVAFARLIAPYRAELQAHCYRMLGSATDAEDALQDALLGAWRGLAGFAGRSSLRSWLYTIVTHACLRAAARRRPRLLPLDHGPATGPHGPRADALAESTWIEPFDGASVPAAAVPEARYEQREAIELAFVAALQHLPARQRAVLILRDVLGFSARETASALHATPASIDSALQRAHRTVDTRLPQRSQQQTLRAIGDDALTRTVTEFVAAWESADVDALVAMLADDAVLAMPPEPAWFSGAAAIGEFLGTVPLAPGAARHRLLPITANGQPAFGHYSRDRRSNGFARHAITVLTLGGRGITELTFFRGPTAFAGFDLPYRLGPSGE
jgi:RNA polymerase sigma-70 factor (ECF subfamily)